MSDADDDDDNDDDEGDCIVIILLLFLLLLISLLLLPSSAPSFCSLPISLDLDVIALRMYMVLPFFSRTEKGLSPTLALLPGAWTAS